MRYLKNKNVRYAACVVLLCIACYFIVHSLSSQFSSKNVQQQFTQNNTNPLHEVNPATLDYFYAVALGAEYGNNQPSIRKWNKEKVGLKLFGTPTDTDTACLKTVMSDFNSISSNTDIELSESNSDIAMYFAPESEFKRILPQYVPVNMGYFWTTFNDAGNLTSATTLISTTGVTSDERCHLIREELTQSMGLMKDSPLYPDSIFYDKWTSTTKYSAIDKDIIAILYGSNGVEADLNKDQVEMLFQRRATE